MLGKFSDYNKEYQVNKIGKYYKPWFFTHVKKILNENKKTTELIPLRDYYHRHSKSIFWEV